MYHWHAVRLVASFVAGMAVVCVSASLGRTQLPDEAPADRPLYHADPEHLWNRLHEALYVRTGPDGRRR